MAVQPCTEHDDCRQDRGLAIACASLRSSHLALPPRNEVLSLGPFVIHAGAARAVSATVNAHILNAQLRLPNSVASCLAVHSIRFGGREQLLSRTLETDDLPMRPAGWYGAPLDGQASSDLPQGELPGEDFCWRYESSYVFGSIAAGETVQIVVRNISGNDVIVRPTIFGIASP